MEIHLEKRDCVWYDAAHGVYPQNWTKFSADGEALRPGWGLISGAFEDWNSFCFLPNRVKQAPGPQQFRND